MESVNICTTPPLHQSYWNLYFKKFGCISCGRTDAPHDRCGFCVNCRGLIVGKLKQVLRTTR